MVGTEESDENMLVVVTGIILAGILGIWCIRFLGETGVISTNGRISSWTMKKNAAASYPGERLEKTEVYQVFAMAFAIRIVIYIVGSIICMLFSDSYSAQSSFSLSDFLNSWNLWDSPHYIDLAKSGYQDCIEDGQHLFLVFFPLYPWLMRLFHVFTVSWEAAGLLLSTVAFCIGSVFFYGAVKEEYGAPVAKRAFCLLNVFPFAFFFGGIMTESLFFCLMSAGFFYIRRHKWLAAGIIGLFCSLCRVQGILLMGVGLVEFFVTYRPGMLFRQKKGKEFWKAFFTKCIWLFLMPVGNFIYFGINYFVEGDLFRFQIYQKEHWYHSTTWFSNCLSEIWGNLFGTGTTNNLKMCIWLPELAIFIIAVILIVYALRRHPLKYSAFLIVYTIVNYSVTFLISGGRYMACALPMFVIAAEWTQQKPKVYTIVLLLSALLFGVYFTGYLTGQQIM